MVTIAALFRMMPTNTPGNYCSLSGEFALLMISERSDKRIDYNCAADSVNSGVKGREELIVFHFIRKVQNLPKNPNGNVRPRPIL